MDIVYPSLKPTIISQYDPQTPPTYCMQVDEESNNETTEEVKDSIGKIIEDRENEFHDKRNTRIS